MEIKINETIYEKSDDTNIIYQYTLTKQEIHIDKLEKELNDLNQEINNSTKLLLGGEERYANIGYDINIFSKDMYPVSSRTNCQTIASTVNTELQIKYGFKRQSYIDNALDVNDKSVHRVIIRYDGVLDIISDYIYQ